MTRIRYTCPGGRCQGYREGLADFDSESRWKASGISAAAWSRVGAGGLAACSSATGPSLTQPTAATDQRSTDPARHPGPERPAPSLRPRLPLGLPTACAETGTAWCRGIVPLPPGRLQFRIYLPPCYDADTSQTYPSLYLIHGQTFNDDQWERIGAPAAADRLIATDAVPPFIIVMPYDRSSAQPWEDPFDEAVVEELIPTVESSFRACPERECRAVGGLSRGGWAITRPDPPGPVQRGGRPLAGHLRLGGPAAEAHAGRDPAGPDAALVPGRGRG
jgi:S-formylglutathione hydrolase FrmB